MSVFVVIAAVVVVLLVVAAFVLILGIGQGALGGGRRTLARAAPARDIDYTSEDFLARVRELSGDGVDVALDGIGGAVSLRSYRALRRGGRLVIFGHYSTLAEGRKSMRGWLSWYAATACVGLAGLASPTRRVLAYRIAKLKQRHPDWFREDLTTLFALLQEEKIQPLVAERLQLDQARRAHELLGRAAVEGELVLIPERE